MMYAMDRKIEIVFRVGRKAVLPLIVVIVFFLLPYLLIVVGSGIFPVHMHGVSVPSFTYVDGMQTRKGEPVNIVFVGFDMEKDRTFESLGWIPLERLWKEGAGKALSDLPKGVTPISNRYLSGRLQDLSYQGSDSGIGHRHHIRLWQEGSGSTLPVYYATASYDQTVGFMPSWLFFVPTHIIAPNIDSERDLIGNLFEKEFDADIRYIDGATPSLLRFNGNNAWYYTDGMVMVVSRTTASDTAGPIFSRLRRLYFGVITTVLKAFGIATE